MNEILRSDSDILDFNRLQAIVARRALPEFVDTFEIRLADFDGDPAAWITFRLAGDDDVGLGELTRRAELLADLHRAIEVEWVSAGSDRFLFFRSEYAAAASSD